MKRVSKLLPLFLLAGLLTIPAYGQTGSMNGKVIDTDGKPLAGATINIDRKEITQHFDVKTDKSGSFTYNGLPIGTYKVTVMKDGQVVTGADGIPIKSGSPTNIAPFDLRSGGGGGGGGNNDEAKAKIEAQKKAQEETKASFNAGLAAAQAKDWPTAIKDFQDAAEKDPTQHVIFAQLGGAYAGAHKYPEAADAYKKAIELKPDEAGYYNNLGIVLGNAGKVDDATAAFQKSAELNPAGAGQAYYNLGAVLLNTSHTKEAAAAFQKAIDVKPDLNEAYYQMGIALMADQTKLTDSMAALQKYIDLQKTGGNVDAAKQLIDALKAQAPASYKSDDKSKGKKSPF